METKRKTHTSTAVKQKYNAKTYIRYTISLRKKEDAAIIAYLEGCKEKSIQPTDAIRALFDNARR